MVESWNMSTRLLMLTLTVGAFVAMWSGDHQDSRQDQTQLERIRRFQRTLPGRKLPVIQGVRVTLFWEEAETESDPDSVSDSAETGFSIECLPEADWRVSKRDEHSNAIDSIPMNQIITSSLKTEDWNLTSMVVWRQTPEMPVDLSEKTIPLPVDLAPGEYRIFNDTGGEYLKTWTAEELASIGIPGSVPELNSYLLEEQGLRWFFYRENQQTTVSTRIESETEQAAAISATTEACDVDVSVAIDPLEPIAERILFVTENVEMSLCRMEEFFSSIHRNVKARIRETADSWAGMTADAIQRTRQRWEDREDETEQAERVETEVIGIRSADRFRCRRFY
jgi:hypothetical protein